MYDLLNYLRENENFNLIVSAYEGKVAERSKLPYMNHIVEGAYVIWLHSNRSFDSPIIEFCLHPIFQSDEAVKKVESSIGRWRDIRPEYIVRCMEYRKTANAYLSTKAIKSPSEIKLSPLDSVNLMLIGDKVQNKKDFMKHMYKNNDRETYSKASDKYLKYFDSWLSALSISYSVYEKYESILNECEAEINGFVQKL